MPNITDWLKPAGELITSTTARVLELIPSEFLASETTSKIVSILISVLLIWLALHFAETIKKPLAYVLVVLFILLILSVIATFIP